MKQKNSMEIDMFKTLCEFDGSNYISKIGDEYVEALSKTFNLNNINDTPFTIEEIKRQPLLQDFKFPGKNEYKYICKLYVKPLSISQDGKRTNEKIFTKDFAGEEEKKIFNKSLGVSYIMTCVLDGNEHLIKIGSSRTSFKKRLGSYNCGVLNNWRTASTTNIRMLQSFVTIRSEINLYIYDCSEELYILDWQGVRSVPFASPKALAVEDIMIKSYIEQFKIKPLANIQANATEIK